MSKHTEGPIGKKGELRENLAIAQVRAIDRQIGIENHKRIGHGTKQVWLGWLREINREIEKERAQ